MLLYPELVTSTIEMDGVFFCTLELATSTIEAEGAFFCMGATKARVHSVFYS